MYTDWVLVHRLAVELSKAFAGGRVQGAGHLPDGRFALEIWKRGATSLAAFDVFSATPVVTVEDGELTIESEPGFMRRTGAALRNMTVETVRSRRGDRVLRFEFSARSRFGVQSGYALIAELVPKFGNLILLKDRTIVNALKEFSAAQNTRRSICAGDEYEPPPLDVEPRASAETLAANPDLKTYRAHFPLLPQMVAQSFLLEAPGDAPRLADLATAFLADFEHHADVPMIVYRRDRKLVQAHVIPLRQFDELNRTTEESLLPLLAESRSESLTSQESDRVEKRRRSLTRNLREREDRLRKELAAVETKFQRAETRDRLRSEGEAIFATLYEREAAEQDAAKEEAAALFGRYRKLTASLPHLESRRGELNRALDVVLELQWEVERASDADVEDVAAAVEHLDSRRPRHQPAKRPTKAKKPLSILTPDGSRIFVGRSPAENAELTFRVAKPDDLWFHTQKIPGAHVILQRDDRKAPSDADVQAAASLAAFYSKAKASPKVLVDYTQRKFVRKQPAAPPGLVFYTNPKSIYVEPKELKP